MKKNLLGLVLTSAIAAAFSVPASAAGPTAADLINDARTSADVTTFGMGYDQHGF